MKCAVVKYCVFLMMSLLIFVDVAFAAEPRRSTNGIMTYQAETAKLVGNVRVSTDEPGFSGSGYVTGFEKDGDACLFTVTVPADAFYDFNFVSKSFPDQYKENIVTVDGGQVGAVNVTGGTFTNSLIRRIYLTKGSHTIGLVKSWGWISLDKLQIKESAPLPKDLYSVSAKLINPQADDNAKRLMAYLTDIYGKKMLSGQTAQNGIDSAEWKAIVQLTGKKPAVLAFDFMDASLSRVALGTTCNTVEKAVEFDRLGGIVTICWHWNAPTKYITGIWYKAFYTDATNINLKSIMDGEDKEGYDLLLADIDAIALELKQLEKVGVPVLWRPLHEASGGWFWWGAAGPEPCKKLWVLLYERLAEHHGLNNLIWVWNGQAKDWYPGDGYVDIIGEDIYAGERNYTSQADRFFKAVGYSPTRKIVVLSENGTLFDPDLAVRDGALWAYFATWCGGFVVEADSSYSEKHTEKEMLKKVYRHPAMVTLDKLPDLKRYPIK